MPLGLHQNWNSIAPAQSQGPVPQPVYRQQYDEPQNAPISVRPAQPTNYRQPGGTAPFVFAGDATGGQIPGMNFHTGGVGSNGFYATTGAGPEVYPGSAPDGTDGGYTGYAMPMRGQMIMDMLSRAAAARAAQPNLLQGIFGGTPAQSPPMITRINDAYTSNQRAFDDMMGRIAQYQMQPQVNLRRYINPNFGRGSDWQNQFIDF